MSVLWVLLPYLLLPWVGGITLWGDFVTLISEHLYFLKTHIAKKICGCKEEANEPVYISFRVKIATTLQSHEEVLLLPLG